MDLNSNCFACYASSFGNGNGGTIQSNYYMPLSDLPEEDYDEEYFAMGLESYFGLWSHDPSNNGFVGIVNIRS